MRRMVAALVLVLGCSHGFDRGRIRERLASEKVQVTDDDIRAALALDPQLRFPIKLGIVFADDEPRDRYDPRGVAFRWREQDRDALLAAADRLRAKGVLSKAFVVLPDFAEGTDLKHVRLTAARHGADAVLVVRGAAQIDRYADPLAVFYLTIVGGFFVPANHRDALFAVRCAMWDVGNGYLYLSAESEGTAKRIGPAFLLEDGPALDAAKEDALRGLETELVRRLSAIAGS